MGMMGTVLLGVGAVSFVGYLIWLIICIHNWDSKIPPIIGMLLSLVMLVSGLSTVPTVQNFVRSGLEAVTSKQEAPKEAAPENTSEDGESSGGGPADLVHRIPQG